MTTTKTQALPVYAPRDFRAAEAVAVPAGAARTAAEKSPAALLAVVVNGEDRQTHAATLAELIAEAGYADARIATALNGQFVPARTRAATALADGDKIEIVAPRQGG